METSVSLSSAVASNSGNGRPTKVPDYHSSSHLPLDIVIDILSRLPVKTLIRFKCVSKHWNDIISSSPYLVSMHLARNQPSANHIICTYTDRSNDDQIRTVVLSCPDDPIPVYCDQHPVICSSGDLGLLLLQLKDPMPSWHQSKSEFALWNPATRQVKLLFRPPFEPPTPRLRQYSDACGVGLDLVANVVKVVLVRNYAFVHQYEGPETKLISPVYVYTLGGGWRKLTGDYPCHHPQAGIIFPIDLCDSTHFNGSIYWISYASEPISIVIFDLGTEVFHKIDCPIHDLDDDRSIWGPYIYRDSIAVFATDSSNVEVWLLSGSNEGVGELCWIKQSSIIGPPTRELELHAIFTDNKLVALTRDDESRKYDLVVFDTRKQQVKLVIPNICLDGLFTYRETLVCIQ
ncbi:F-box only protein 8 [Linum grandiflorum]